MAGSKVLAYNGQAPNGINLTTGMPMEQPTRPKKKTKKKASAPKSAKLA